MDYEKKYLEALEKARQFSERPLEEDSSSIVEYIFPELADSEDERIRKALIRFHKSTIDVDGIKGEDIIAWLEKQGNNLVENANIQQKDFAPKATAANRQLYNRAILKILSDYVEKYPDIRFGQMLCNLGIGPVFNEESQEIYLNLNEIINKQNHE